MASGGQINTKNKKRTVIIKATITRYDLSPRCLCIDVLKAISYESTSLNRIVADESHRVIVA